MSTQIVSKGIDVSPALRERIMGRIDEMMDKYIHRDGSAQVLRRSARRSRQCPRRLRGGG